MPIEIERRHTITYMNDVQQIRRRLNNALIVAQELREKIDPHILDEPLIRRSLTFLSEFEPDSPAAIAIKSAIIESYLSRINTQKRHEVKQKSHGLIRAIHRLTILHKFIIFNPKRLNFLSKNALESVIAIIDQVGQTKDLDEQGRLLQHAERTLIKRKVDELRQRESAARKENILARLRPEKQSQ